MPCRGRRKCRFNLLHNFDPSKWANGHDSAANLLQHHSVPLGKLLRVTLRGICEAGNGALAEEETEHAANVATADLKV